MRLVLVALLFGCGNGRASGGLPPATDWATDDPTGGAVAPDRPHAPAHNPHGDPHAGVPGAPGFGAASAGQGDPHAGVPGAPPLGDTGGVDFEEPPVHGDVIPDQPSNPARRVRGILRVGTKAAGRLKPDGVIFLMAKLPDAAGQPTGAALAVDRTFWKSDGQAFELGGASGEVLVIARYDQDGDGSTTEPGDVIGMARVRVPADNVVIELATVVE
jgi:hypothetical protein